MPKNSKAKSKKVISIGKTRKAFKFKSKVIVWAYGTDRENIDSAWRFARVPEDISAKIIKMQKEKPRRGWGAIYAKAKIKKTEWTTSIFPDWYSPTYILPLKKQIRYKENLYDGTQISITIEIWF